MGRRQDESEAARKQLIELSREFKKTATEVNKTKSRSTSFFFGVGGGGGWFLAGFLNELSRHRKLGHQYLRTCTLTYLQVLTAVVVFMCLVSVLFCVCGKTLLITSGTNHQGRQPLVDRFYDMTEEFPE
jgi:hypothetical protein